MKIIAIVICYKPTPELLLRSLASYAGSVDKLLVWRNSSLPDTLEKELSSRFGAEFRGDGTNVGISKALNAAWKEAAAGNYDCLLTMDHDSVWHDFDAYVSQASAQDLTKRFFSPLTIIMGCTPSPAQLSSLTPLVVAMTSGMLIPISVLDSVGGWDENLKVDAVDDEICLHAASLGIQCWRCGDGWLEHRLGDKRRVSFLGLHFHTYNYSPERLYSIFRNHIIVFRKYKGEASKKARHLFVRVWVYRRPIRILLGEEKRWTKIHAILRGIKDGFLYRL